MLILCEGEEEEEEEKKSLIMKISLGEILIISEYFARPNPPPHWRIKVVLGFMRVGIGALCWRRKVGLGVQV